MTGPKRYKLCTSCGESKSVEDFYRRKTGHLARWCKPCDIADVSRRKSAARAAARAEKLAQPQPAPLTEKQCIHCDQIKPIDQFLKRESGRRRGECNECRNVYAREYSRDVANRARISANGKAYAARNPAKLWAQRLLKYGLTPEQYDAIYDRQQGTCAVCGVHRERADGGDIGGGNVLCIDHCHDTGAVRGLLCSGCNRGIGLLGDNPERLLAAINYLRAGEPDA